MDTQAITVGPAPDHETFLRTDQTVWFGEVGRETPEQQLLGVPAGFRYAAQVDGADPATYPGIYGVRPMTLSVPGTGDEVRRVPCAGLTWVGVHPDHRRRGVLTAMLRHHFETVRDEPGWHLSALHASEPAIYGRHGYGLASLEHSFVLGRGAKLTAPHLDAAAEAVRTTFGTASDPGIASRVRRCWEGGAGADVGIITGEDDFYEAMCASSEEDLRGKEPVRVLFAHVDGEDVGLAGFRREQKWEHGRPGGNLTVFALVGGPVARLALLRRLVDFDLIGTVKVWSVGVADPMLTWLGSPRGASEVAVYDNLWVRLVDLPKALEARGYAAACDLVLDVSDTSAPWNAGRWRLRVDGSGAADVQRTEADADLRLPVQVLGALYLGDVSPVGLVRAGLVEQARAGAARALWHAVRTEARPAAATGF